MTSDKPSLHCQPEQRLVITGELPKALQEAWSAGDAPGVLALALGEHVDDHGMSWAREWGRSFLACLCQVRDWEPSKTPQPEEVTAHLTRVPDMLGAEYVTKELLVRIWTEMLAHVRVLAQDDLEGWLQNRTGAWESVGRVTLRLAENKNDPVRPFAFIATYAERLSSGGKLQQLPLARALQLVHGLQRMMPRYHRSWRPCVRPPKRSPLIHRLVATKHIFQALAWTPSEG